MLDHALDYALRGWRVLPVRDKKSPLIDRWQERASAELDLLWQVDGGAALLEETRRLTFFGTHTERWIDIVSNLQALDSPVVFGDTKEGSMAMRLHPALRLEGELARGAAQNSEGIQGKQIWGKRGSSPWTPIFIITTSASPIDCGVITRRPPARCKRR